MKNQKVTTSEAKKMRYELGLTQAEAAKLVHLSARQWRRMESIERMPPVYAELFALKTLGFTPRKIILGRPKKEDILAYDSHIAEKHCEAVAENATYREDSDGPTV